MASSIQRPAADVRQSERRARGFTLGPVFALLPVIMVGQVKATGFNSIGGVDTTVLSVILLLIVSGAVFVKDPHYPLKKIWPWFLFNAVVLVGVMRSDAGAYQSLKARDFFLLTGVIVLCIPILLRTTRDLRSLVAVWFVGGAVVALLVLMIGGAQDLYGRAGIGEATLGPAYLSAAAVVVGACSLGEKLFPAAIAVPGIGIAGIALIAIGSRGPLIAATAGLVTWILLRGALRIRTVLVVLVVTSVSIVGVERASEVSLSRLVLNDPGRTDLWRMGARLFVQHPLLGLGWGDFSTVLPPALYPHNLFLEAAVELGLLGLLALTVLLTNAISGVWRTRSRPETRVVAALAVAMWMGQQFSSDLSNRLFWIALIPCLILPLPESITRSGHRAARNASLGSPRTSGTSG